MEGNSSNRLRRLFGLSVSKKKLLFLLACVMICGFLLVYEVNYVHGKHFWIIQSARHSKSFIEPRSIPADGANVNIIQWTGERDQGTFSVDCNQFVVNFRRREDSLESADAVLFNAADVSFTELPLRYKNQKWILSYDRTAVQSPCPSNGFGCVNGWLQDPELTGVFDWSLSYRADATFFKPQIPLDGSLVSWFQDKFLPGDRRQVRSVGTSPVLWVCDECEDDNGRLEYVQELMRYIEVDSCGSCLRNGDPRKYGSVEEMYRSHKFYLSFESVSCDGYITDQFYKAVEYGLLPVVLGGEDYSPFVPTNHSIINARDFASPEVLASYLKEVDKNDDLFSSYFSYKSDLAEIPSTFVHRWSSEKTREDFAKSPWCDMGKALILARSGDDDALRSGVPADTSCIWKRYRAPWRGYGWSGVWDIVMIGGAIGLFAWLILVRNRFPYYAKNFMSSSSRPLSEPHNEEELDLEAVGSSIDQSELNGADGNPLKSGVYSMNRRSDFET